MKSKKHAVLPPSSAFRWINCTPSALINAAEGDGGSSDAAKEGSAAHALAEHKLKRLLKIRSRRPHSDYDSDEMEECTDAYAAFVMEQVGNAKEHCPDPVVLVEQQLDLGTYIPEGFGTADCLIAADDELTVIDLKYGKGIIVDAEKNPQMMIYALGAVDLFLGLYQFETVNMNIFQPRREHYSTWTISVQDLLKWAEEVLTPKASIALEGSGEFAAGDWCVFCKNAPICRARAMKYLQLTQKEFAFKSPAALTDDEIGAVLIQADELARWAGDVLEYAQEQAIDHGKHFQGFKVCEGRSVRKFSDLDAVAEAAKKAGYEDIWDKKLISLTGFEKLMGKQKFQEILGEYVVKPKGKLVLVPESDARPAVDIGSAEMDFKGE